MKAWFWFIFLSAAAFEANAQSDLFVELLAGQSERESETVDDPALGIRGGYAFTENFSVELAYKDYGENTETINFSSVFIDPDTVFGGIGVDSSGIIVDSVFIANSSREFRARDNISAYSLGVVWTQPMSDRFSILGRVGASSTDVEIETTVIGFPEVDSTELEVLSQNSIDDNGTSVYLGVGIRYDISGRFFVGAEYEMSDVEFLNSTIDTGTASLSLGIQL